MTAFVAFALLQVAQTGWKPQTIVPGVRVTGPALMPATDAPGTWVAETDNAAYMLSLLKPTADEGTEVSSLLDLFMLGGLQQIGGIVVAERDILANGWPGVAFSIRGKAADGAFHLFVFSGRTVCTGVMYPAGHRPPNADRFLDSLILDPAGPRTKPGAELHRFPLGKSGLTALFPRKPDERQNRVGKGNMVGTMYVLSSTYALREYRIGYREIPPSLIDTDEHLRLAREMATNDALKSMSATKKQSRETKVGAGTALDTDFTADPGTGRVRVYVHGGKVLMLLFFGAPGWDPASCDEFFASVAPL